jgi:hypothetical protein
VALIARHGVEGAETERHRSDPLVDEVLEAAVPPDAGPFELREALARSVRELDPDSVLTGLGVRGDAAAERLFAGVCDVRTILPEARNFQMFEERPWSLIAGAVRARLTELGARLPPGARLVFRDSGSPSRLLADAVVAPFVRRMLKLRGAWRWGRERSEVLRSLSSWNPSRARGPRFQPLLEPMGPVGAPEIERALAESAPPGAPPSAVLGSPAAAHRRLLRHAARCGAAAPVERYWLLLPDDSEGAPERI